MTTDLDEVVTVESEEFARSLEDAIRSSEGSVSLEEIESQHSLVVFLRSSATVSPRRRVAGSRTCGAHTTSPRRSQ